MELAELYSYPFIDLNTFSIEKPNYKSNTSIKVKPTTDISVDMSVPTVNVSHVEINDTTTEGENTVLCRVCGKPLKDVNSRVLGMGPFCYKQFKVSRSKQINLFDSTKTNKG